MQRGSNLKQCLSNSLIWRTGNIFLHCARDCWRVARYDNWTKNFFGGRGEVVCENFETRKCIHLSKRSKIMFYIYICVCNKLAKILLFLNLWGALQARLISCRRLRVRVGFEECLGEGAYIYIYISTDIWWVLSPVQTIIYINFFLLTEYLYVALFQDWHMKFCSFNWNFVYFPRPRVQITISTWH